ncbi:MAG: gliding motility-associated C-terminal domain-containing protein, partial [Mameliella sp.]|nr:gliding motility-associated C-terminal domain-containing protein [Phaeodactylibacter sp.]
TSQGCDSLVIINTAFEAIPLTEINGNTCQIEQVGISFDTLSSAAGCDSILQYNLTFDPGFQSNLPDAFSCDELEWGVDTTIISGSNGCDSLLIQETLPAPPAETMLDTQICAGDFIIIGTLVIDGEGTYYDTLSTVANCDSIIRYNLTVYPEIQTSLPATFSCDELEWGTDTTILTSMNGCDSLVIQEILPALPAETVLDTQICTGESLLFGSQLIESEGAYFDTLFTVAGCDSIITLNVAVTSDAPFSVTEYLCPGDTVIFGGDLITGPGQFTETFTDQFGCDSTVLLTVEGIDAEAFSLTPDEQIILEGNTSVTFSLTDNDQLPPDYTLDLTQMPLHGTANISEEGELTYELTNTSFLGVDSFGYRACTQLCVDTCIETSIHISTLADCLTEIQANLPTDFTPDGDGINDELDPLREVIDVGCLQGPERATMRVLNRWGEVVFEATPYRSWDGRYTNGQVVPQGTYYYILTFELDGENVITQYVHVLRTE